MIPFDEVLVVDWSASNAASPKPAPNSIWIGRSAAPQGKAVETSARHFPTRLAAEDWLARHLDLCARSGLRVLAGFDFAFGYPSGFAARLTGQTQARAVWHWLAQRITDTPDNRNNRFAVAAQINAGFGGSGPFWGNPGDADLPRLKPAFPFAGLPEHRQSEAKGAKSLWQLYGNGAVGSQSLMGLPMLHRLATTTGAAVWPFDPPDGPLVLAEVYPSLLRRPVAAAVAQGWVADAAQVRLLSRALWQLSQAGALGPLWNDRGMAPDEGAVLGARHADALEAALQW